MRKGAQVSGGMKYIVYDGAGGEEAILFPCWRQHSDMLHVVPLSKIISAGHLKRNDKGELYCCGNSVILKFGSRPKEDLEIIMRLLAFDI
jgi:hypothetical protein